MSDVAARDSDGVLVNERGANMFGSDILGVAIGLVLVYLLLSIICTATNELIEAALKNRAKDLERGIREMLGGDAAASALASKIYNHALIFGLFKGGYDAKSTGNLPSYIPARNFSLALLDVLQPADQSARSGTTLLASPSTLSLNPAAATVSQTLAPANLRNLVSASTTLGQKPKQALLALIDASAGDAQKLQGNLEGWYNTSMDRVAGWYKRRTQVIILCLSLLVVLAVNADTIALFKSIANDPALRNSLVAAAPEYAKAAQQSPSATPINENACGRKSSNECRVAVTVCASSPASPECRVATNMERIGSLGLPIGWDRDDHRVWPENGDWHSTDFWTAWGSKVTGWLLTALAISLGAPFWFDVLNKFMTARSTLKPKTGT